MTAGRSKWFLRVLAVILVLLVASAAALVLYLELSDLQRHRALIQSVASAILQREVRLEGELELDIGPTLRVRAGRIRIGNPPWLTDPWMVDLRGVEVGLQAASLLRAPPVFRFIHADGGTLLLHRDAALGGNWEFAQDDPPGPYSNGDEQGLEHIPLVIQRLDAGKLDVVLRAPRIPQGLLLHIASLEINEDPGGIVQLSGTGTLEGTHWELSGSLGTVQSLVRGRDLALDLDLHAERVNIHFEARAEALRNLSELDAELLMDGPALERLTDLVKWPIIATGPYSLAARATHRGDVLSLALRGRASAFEVELDTTTAGAFTDDPAWDIQGQMAGPDLGALADTLGVPGLASEPFTLQAEAHFTRDETLFRNVVLRAASNRLSVDGRLGPPPGFAGSSLLVDVHLQDARTLARRFEVPWQRPGPLDLSATIAQTDRGMELRQATLSLGPDTLRASGLLGDLARMHGAELSVEASVSDLQDLGRALGVEDLPRLEGTLTGSLRSADGVMSLQEAKLESGPARASARGTLARAGPAPALGLWLQVDVPDLSMLSGRAAWLPSLPAANLSGSAHMELDTAEHLLLFRDVALALDSTNIRGTAQVPLGETDDLARLEVSLAGGDLRALGRLAGTDRLPALPFEAAGNLVFFRDRMHLASWRSKVGDTRLESPAGVLSFASGMSGSRLQLKASGPDARTLAPELRDRTLQPLPFQLAADLQASEGRLRISRLEGEAAGMEIRLSGDLERTADFSGTRLDFSLRTGDVSQPLSVIQAEPVAAIPASASGSIEVDQTSFRARGIEVAVGEDHLTMQAEYSRGEAPLLAFTLDSDRLNLDRLLAIRQRLADPPERASRRDTLLIPELPLPIGWLEPLKGQLRIDIRELTLWDRQFGDVRGAGHAGDGELVLESLAAAYNLGSLELSGTARVVDEALEAQMQFTMRDVRLGLMSQGAPLQQRPATDLQMSLAGRGSSLRELVASASGPITAAVGPGKVDGAGARIGSDLLLQVINALNPFAESPQVVTECGLATLRARDGVVDSEIFMVQTNTTLTVAQGRIDLRSEGIEFFFNVMPRRGLGLSMSSITNPYFKIAGTLGHPSLTLAPTRAAISYGAAVATGGLSILAKAFVDRLRSGGPVCQNELAKRGIRLPGSDRAPASAD